MTDLARIDDGPVATVYAGHRAGVPVALKVFPKRFDKRTMSAFAKEQSKLSTVRRITSILMVDGVEEMPSGESALRMELCTQSLSALVDRVGPLAATDVAILGRAMATALAAAHSVGISHGGVSPHNVLFRENNEPVVADFGITLRQAFTRDPLHAIEYLPPETLRTGTLNELTDLYGLGAVLHFALTARSPHPGRLGEQPGERVLRILGEPVPAINRADVPIGLSTLVARLLATTPERRPQDAAQVADQLTAMLPNPPTPTTTEDWDDFDQPPPPPLPTLPEDPLDFDDFAPRPPGSAWPPGHVGAPSNGRPPVSRATAPPPVRSPHPPSAAVSPPPAVAQLPAPPATWPPPGPLGASVETPPEPPALPLTPASSGTHAEMLVPAAEPVAPPEPPPTPLSTTESVPPPASQLPETPAPPAEAPVAPPAPEVSAAEPIVSAQPLLDQPDPQPPVPVTSAPPSGDEAAQGAVASAHPRLSPAPLLPLAPPPTPARAKPDGVLRPPEPGHLQLPIHNPLPADTPSPAEQVDTPRAAEPADSSPPADTPPSVGAEDALLETGEAPETVEFPLPRRPGVVLGGSRRDLDLDDGFGDDFGNARRATVLAGPLTPPGQPHRRLVRYDLLAGVALLLALLALVPLLLLRSDPEEMSSTPKVPTAGGGDPAGEVTVELAQPTDLTDKVQLNWKSTRDLDFAVVVAAEGESTRVLLAQRNHSMTVDIESGLKYCFLVQASDGDRVYESEPQPLRGATCRK